MTAPELVRLIRRDASARYHVAEALLGERAAEEAHTILADDDVVDLIETALERGGDEVAVAAAAVEALFALRFDDDELRRRPRLVLIQGGRR